jgi:hypothetical protein
MPRQRRRRGAKRTQAAGGWLIQRKDKGERMKRFIVRQYWSRIMRQKVWQVVDTTTEQWVYESLDKSACSRKCRELNQQAQAVTA